MVRAFVWLGALLVAGVGAQDGPSEWPISEAAASRAFEEAREASAADAGELWGKQLYGPLFFVDPGTRFVVANQVDNEGQLIDSEGLWIGELPQGENIANTATRWAGVHWTMVMWPLPENRYDRTRLLIHECFHRIQGELGFSGSNPGNNHLDGRDGRTWLRMEFRALAEALIRRGEARRAAAEDALVFRAHRRSLSERAAAEERALEMNEGLAEYTGLRLCGLPDHVLADRAAVRLEREERGEAFVRSFAYATGPAYGIMLDEAGADWREGLTSDDDLGYLLARALDISVIGDLKVEAHQRASRYDGGTVIAEEDERAATRDAQHRRQRARFVDGPVLVIPLGPDLGYSFNPNAANAFGERGTVFWTARVTDAWGILEVDDGVLLQRDGDGRMARATVPAPSDPAGSTISGDGWTLTLNEGWRVTRGPREGDWVVVP
ncbi:MAG: hypothetical protein ACYTCU_11655 [Planctomycetota bacterium]|jgi:hypothetical protein